jgi:hypothetical protein
VDLSREADEGRHVAVALAGGVRVTGLRETVRHLESLGVDVADLKDAFGRIAAYGARLAAGFAPHQTGKLAASIKGNRSKNYAVIKAGAKAVPYAGAINYGWPKRHIAAAGFMQRADAALRPYALRDIQAELTNLVQRKGLQ